MSNIYAKQMQRLGLNPRQYAELTDMPYEVVKDFIYDKEGDYKMGLKDLLRKNMIERHQEIEENFEGAKIQASAIKYNDDKINYFDWYKNEYSTDLMKEKLGVKTISEFKKNYDLTFLGDRFSNWTYQLLLGKKEYEGHEIAQDKKLEFIRQLYDIIVNGNGENYLRSIPLSSRNVNSGITKDKNKILKWYRKFNLRKYLTDNNLTQVELSKRTGINNGTLNHMVLHGDTNYVTNNVRSLYNYVMNNPTPKQEVAKEDELTQDVVDKINDHLKTLVEMQPMEEPTEVTEDDNNTTSKFETFEPVFMVKDVEPKIEMIDTNNNVLKKILINRLTDEEKELIRIFGGNLEI